MTTPSESLTDYQCPPEGAFEVDLRWTKNLQPGTNAASPQTICEEIFEQLGDQPQATFNTCNMINGRELSFNTSHSIAAEGVGKVCNVVALTEQPTLPELALEYAPAVGIGLGVAACLLAIFRQR